MHAALPCSLIMGNCDSVEEIINGVVMLFSLHAQKLKPYRSRTWYGVMYL